MTARFVDSLFRDSVGAGRRAPSFARSGRRSLAEQVQRERHVDLTKCGGSPRRVDLNRSVALFLIRHAAAGTCERGFRPSEQDSGNRAIEQDSGQERSCAGRIGALEEVLRS